MRWQRVCVRAGQDWAEHRSPQFDGVASFFRPGDAASLVSQWRATVDAAIARGLAGIGVEDPPSQEHAVSEENT
jgi:hypothetical protein